MFRLGLLRRIKYIIPMMKDKSVAWWKKAIIIAGVVYLVLPVDLIPPIIPVFGWLDDVIVWVAILYFMGSELDKYAPDYGPPTGKQKYDYKDTDVHEVNFSVSEEEESNE